MCRNTKVTKRFFDHHVRGTKGDHVSCEQSWLGDVCHVDEFGVLVLLPARSPIAPSMVRTFDPSTFNPRGIPDCIDTDLRRLDKKVSGIEIRSALICEFFANGYVRRGSDLFDAPRTLHENKRAEKPSDRVIPILLMVCSHNDSFVYQSIVGCSQKTTDPSQK